MRTVLLALLVLVPSVGRGQPPAGGAPKLVPAVPLSADESARRNALAWYGAGRLRQSADRLVDAERHFRASADATPDAVEPLRELAKVSAALGRDPAAVRAARRVLALDPTDGETAELLGKLLFESKQFADAAKAYRQAADSPPFADRPAVRFRCLRRAATAAERVPDAAAAEAALRPALRLLADKKNAFLTAGMTVREHARLRAALYERLGKAELSQQKSDAAVAAFETARDLNADPKQANDPAGVIRLHENLAEVFAAAGQFRKAVGEHAKYLSHKPGGVAGYVRHAELLKLADPKAAVAVAMTRLAAGNPTNPAPQWVAAAALAPTDFAAAHQRFQGLAKTADKPDLFPILVAAYRPNRAKELLDIIGELYAAAEPPDKDTAPPEAAVARARAVTAAVKAVPSLAEPLVRQLDTETRNRPFGVYELVTGLALHRGFAVTATDVLQAAARRKTDSRINWLLYETLSAQRRWRELANAAGELKEVGNNRIDLTAASRVAIAYAELGDERRALDALKQIEGRIYVRLQTARVWTALGKPKKAVAECEEILAKDRPRGSDLHDVRVTYAAALSAVKEFGKAEAELRALLEDDPDDVLALNNLGYNLAEQGRKLPEAEALIRRALELDEYERRKRGNPEAVAGTYLDSLAWVLFRRGKAAEARAVFEKVIATPDAGRDAVVWDHYGDVCFRLGDKAKARVAWEKAAELYTGTSQGREAGRLDEVRRKLSLTR